jgi:FeS assembly SUF system protein
MPEEFKLPGSRASLTVLPGSSKVEQLRRELAETSSQTSATPTHQPDPSTSASTPALRIDTIKTKLLKGKIIEAISQVYDPEIPVNVYELGLIYDIAIADDNSVTIQMTLTAPGCPVAGSLPREVEKQVESIDEVKEAEVVLVWEPAWDKSRMSEAALLQLNLG